MLRKKKKPVTVITGYLGSGKTTLINELLRNSDQEGLALIVNDMGSINVDAKLLKNSQVMESETKMIELQNGCICCTLQEAFMTQVEKLSKDERITHIVVEASGISNPASIADGFLTYADMHHHTGVYLNGIVSVVDADRIHAEFLEGLNDRLEQEEEDDEDPDIINLVIDQIEFCNMVVLNKCDLLSKEQIEEVKQVIRSFQKEAEIIECTEGKVPVQLLLGKRRFDYEKVMNSSTLQRALAREKKNEEGCCDEYGISSFVYEERRPFDRDKLMHFIEEEYPDTLIRAKGYIWFAEDWMHVQLFEQAGRNASVTEVSNWVDALPETDKKEVFENYPDVLEDWDQQYGDRMNQIVFIGKQYDRKKIINDLNDCLVG